MIIDHLRLDNNKTSCRGMIYIDGVLYGCVMEDPVRTKKVKGVTAIPAGDYEIKFREEPESKMNQRYREKYDWFTWHLWHQNVKNFQFTYDHVGNKPSHTDGCRLINNIWTCNDPAQLGASAVTFKPYYLKVSAALNRGEKVVTKIRNVFESLGQEIIKEE